MSRHRQRVACLSVFTGIVTLAAIVVPADSVADGAIEAPLVTIEGESAMKARMTSHVVLVTVVPRPGELQDPSFTPRQFGMGVVVAREGRNQIVTSLALVEAADRLEIAMPDGTGSTPAVLARKIVDDGLAVLECSGDGERAPCRVTGARIAGAGTADEGARLYFVTPAGGGGMVVAGTLSAGRADPVMKTLIVAEGAIPMGTPLFDSDGRVAAVVVRPAFGDVHRSLAARLAPAKAGMLKGSVPR